MPASSSLIAIPRPEKPAPTINTSRTSAGKALAEDAAGSDFSRVGKGTVVLACHVAGNRARNTHGADSAHFRLRQGRLGLRNVQGPAGEWVGLERAQEVDQVLLLLLS